MDAAGVIAAYVLDGDRPLTATSNNNTTFYLYGLGAIGEKTSAWSYSLPDGTNTPRQLSDLGGDITLFARYTPWGDTLDTFGTGNFTLGYLGGVLDASTGLLYVGNGQYYDPSTGRFLTRDVYPNSPNPYVPWNPLGAILGPLAVVSLFYTRRKKGSKAGTFLVLLIVLGGVGMALAACGGDTPEATAVMTPDGTATIAFDDATIVVDVTPSPGAPLTPLAIPCPTPSMPVELPLLESEINQYLSLANGLIEATDWVRAYLQGKAQSVLSGLQYVLVDRGPGMLANTANHTVEVSRDLINYSVDSNRTRAIHELGHFVDYYAGLNLFGAPWYSGTAWVYEWETRPDQYPDHPEWTFFTGNFSDLPSDYMLSPNQEHQGRFCSSSPNGGLNACKGEDFAETFTWMVYDSRGLRLETLDYNQNYNRPSDLRQQYVTNAIARLP